MNPETILRTTSLSFDQILARCSPGDTISLAPGGVYETQGPWASPSGDINVPDNVTILAGTARIVLKPPAGITRPDRDLPILRCGTGVNIVGGIWDCNYAGCPGWFTQGIRFHGKFRISSATIVGMSGSRASGTPSGAVESFAISSQGDTGGSVVTECVVKDCKVDSSDDYVSGIYLGATVETSVTSLVQDCVVNLGLHGQFCYSNNQPTDFVRCTGEAARWWYNDTGPTRLANIVRCSGTGHYAAISCVATPGGEHRTVLVSESSFCGTRMVEWWNQATEPMTGGVICRECEFGEGTYFVSSASSSGLLVFDNCKLEDSTAFYQADDSVRALMTSSAMS